MEKVTLKELRKKYNMTQFHVATALGISARYYSMLETGQRTPGFLLANKISNFFGVKIDDINFFNRHRTKCSI